MSNFPLYALADSLREAISSSDNNSLVDDIGALLIAYVSKDSRVDVREMAQNLAAQPAPRDRKTLAALADRILGENNVDIRLEDGLFESPASYFSEPPEISAVTPPVSSNPYAPLPFTDLPSPKTFEHLCYEFIAGSPPEGGVYLYGRSGHAQDGIDILVLPDRTIGRWRRMFYECKQRVEFTEADLVNAIAKFENGLHAHDARTFVIIAASKVLAPSVINAIDREHARLQSTYGIRLEVWDATKFTIHLRLRRDLISSYFGEWHNRAFPHVQTQRDEYPQHYNGWGDELFPKDLALEMMPGLITARNSQVHLQIDVPHIYDDSESLCGAITLRQLEHTQIGLGSRDILELLDQTGATSLEDRTFIQGVVAPGQKTTTMQVGNFRLYPSVFVAEQFCEVVDACNDALVAHLKKHDRRCETEGFQLVRHPASRRNMYRLGTIDELLWRSVEKAATEPGFAVEGAEGLWAIADRLRIFTASESNGVHPYVDVFAVPTSSGADSLELLWDPTPAGIETHWETGWWGAATTARWLCERLTPSAVEHSRQRAADAWLRRPRWYEFWKPFLPVIVPGIPIYLCRPTFIERLLAKADSVGELLPAVNALQAYLTKGARTWDADSRRRILTVLLIAIRRSTFTDANTRYIRTTLFGASSTMDQADITRALEKMLAKSEPVTSGEADSFLRVLGEMLDKGACTLTGSEVRESAELFEPFAKRHDDELLLRLHTPLHL